MSSADLLSEANALFVDDDYLGAIKKYNASIHIAKSTNDSCALTNALIARSTCNYKLKEYTEAIEDASLASRTTPTSAQAMLRKGMALFSLDEYESAKKAFTEGLALDPNEKRLKTWIRKCDVEIEAEEENECNYSEEEDPVLTHTSMISSSPPSLEPDVEMMENVKLTSHSSSLSAPAPIPTNITSVAPPNVATIGPSTRYEWFQTPTQVTIDVFKKAVTEEQLSISFKAKELKLIIQLGEGKEYILNLDLSDEIIPTESTYVIRKTKIEIRLKKLIMEKWNALEKREMEEWKSEGRERMDPMAYPTSARGATSGRDWKKLAKDIGADKEEKLEGDAALNQVFEGIYKNASDEQRMAMMKSFQESGGTVLSTNWDEVGQKKVKGSPPKGMEMHSWDEKNH